MINFLQDKNVVADFQDFLFSQVFIQFRLMKHKSNIADSRNRFTSHWKKQGEIRMMFCRFHSDCSSLTMLNSVFNELFSSGVKVVERFD